MADHPHFLWTDLFKKEPSGKASIINVLKENILFRTLSNRELAYVANFVYERVYQAGEPVFRQGDRGLGMYVISKGRVAIKTEDSSGQEVLVTSLDAGSFFGEIALVDPNNVRTASGVALEPTVLIGFFKPDLMEILERKPATGVKVLFQLSTVLGRRLLETTEKISKLRKSDHGPGALAQAVAAKVLKDAG